MEKQEQTHSEEEKPLFSFEETENEDSADSSSEETDTEQTQSDEGEQTHTEEDDSEKGFDQHPRWKERESDWKERFNEQEERHLKELEKIREEIDSRFQSKSTSEEIPPWFGGDEKQWAEFQKWDEQRISKAKESALQEINNKTQAEQKAMDEAMQFFNDEVSKIESQYGSVDRNKLLKFTYDNELVDTKGRWNYKAAYKMMQSNVDTKKEDRLSTKKKIAGVTQSESKAETKPKNYATPEDFQKTRPW